MSIEQRGSLSKANSINRGNLSANPEFRHPTQADIGKDMYYENGHWVGTFNGLENDQFGDARATRAFNEEREYFTHPPEDMYVEINPRRRGGKSKRRRTKKARRAKSNRRGRKTRGRRR